MGTPFFSPFEMEMGEDDDIPTLIEDEETKNIKENSYNLDEELEGQSIGKKVPVTVITGFLGAGKTTFLKYVLTERHGKRIAVIQNEFAKATGAEEAFLFGDTNDDDENGQREWLDLPNGCVCCAVKDDLALTLEQLCRRKDKFDYIFLETSGLADPGPIAQALWLDNELESEIY